MTDIKRHHDEDLRKDLANIQDRLDDVRHQLQKNLGYLSLATTWYKSLGLRDSLNVATEHLNAVSEVALALAVDLLARIEAMLPSIREIMEAKHERAKALKVAHWVRPFIADLATLTETWMSTFVRTSPQETVTRAQDLHNEIKRGFSQANAAYALD